VFSKILVANRGEIALRVIRACREMGIQSVAVYSEADADSLHVRFADQAVRIGPAPSLKSYLDYRRIIATAEISGAEAIHPGYGFLAENAEFAEMCEESGFTFIGPSPESITIMGDKALAKKTMTDAGVPVTPGSDGIIKDLNEARQIAEEVGFPVIIKASAGGGGKGMRLARTSEALESAFELARAEAISAFSSSDLYLEKFIKNPRHVEVQILADSYGDVIHLGERDCSIQRRHQKLIEESPSLAVTPEIRKKLGDSAVLGAKKANYRGAGTIEFLLDKDGNYHFMEMNTRIQVEHPVTEMVTGIDLIKQQILVAAGEHLSIKQEDIIITGHAIECRINAENPDNNFLPAPGLIETFHVPGGMGVRVDTHAYDGYVIPPQYDSLIAKLIVYGENRNDAINKAKSALTEFIVEGIPTTISFHLAVMNNKQFISGDFSTSFIEEEFTFGK